MGEKSIRYSIQGKVVEKPGDTPLARVSVEVWDKEFETDDYLSSAVSGFDGEFTIVLDGSMFENWGFEHWPKLFFKVFRCGKLLVNTESILTYDVKKPQDVTITVPPEEETNGDEYRHIYLKIEKLGHHYSPVRPQDHGGVPYGRDCARGEGHENAVIPEAEIQARSVRAVIYREYLDSAYLFCNPNKLIQADVTEPYFSHRVPSTVLYARPGQRLKIHVWNSDDVPHSLHVHGLMYGIDSDGTFPFGTQAGHHGGRSDAIRCGETWTYTFEITEDMIGAWAFYDQTYHRHVKIEQGLFGGIVVLSCEQKVPRRIPLPVKFLQDLIDRIESIEYEDEPPFITNEQAKPSIIYNPETGNEQLEPVLLPVLLNIQRLKPASLMLVKSGMEFLQEYMAFELGKPRHMIRTDSVPIFLHVMYDKDSKPIFSSGDIMEAGVFEQNFAAAGDYEYLSMHKPFMTGIIHVVPGAPSFATVAIVDSPCCPMDSAHSHGTDGIGHQHDGHQDVGHEHVVPEASGSIDSSSMAFSPSHVTVGVGGTVRYNNLSKFVHTVTSKQGAAIATHCINGRGFLGNTPLIIARSGQLIRWYIFNVDLGPARNNLHPHSMRWTFAGENIDVCSMSSGNSFMVETHAPAVLLMDDAVAKMQDPSSRPRDAKLYHLKGDFVFHSDVYPHRMNGMIGVVRAKQSVWLTDELAHNISHERGLPIDDNSITCPEVEAEI